MPRGQEQEGVSQLRAGATRQGERGGQGQVRQGLLYYSEEFDFHSKFNGKKLSIF